MKQLTTALANHFQGALTTLATCWKVTRRDGEVFGFTDHDVTLTIDGLKYFASSGYYRTAIANSATVAVDNLEVRGFLDNDFISETDLRNGAYDFAEVEIFAVNWKDLSQGICRLRYGYFGETQLRPSGMFVVELRGLMQLFSQTVGETIMPECRADLGDHRCKVKLEPDIHRTSRNYEVGDRVIVPLDKELTSIGMPIRNQNFDWFQTTSYFSWWTSSNAVFTNFPHEPHTPVYYVRPTGPTGHVRREIWRDPRLNVTLNNPITVEVRFMQRMIEEGWQVGGVLEFIERHGILGQALTIHNTYEIPYMDVDSEDWVQRVFNIDVSQNVVPENSNSFRLTIRWRRNPAYPPSTEPAAVQIDAPFFSNNGNPFNDPYMQFSLPNQTVVSGVPEWSGSFVQTHVGNVNLRPVFGGSYMSRSNWIGQGLASQTVDILAAGALQSVIDAGGYTLHTLLHCGGWDWGAALRLTIQFRNSANNIISTLDSGMMPMRPFKEWLFKELEGPVPPLTRFITYGFSGELTAERQGDGTQPRIGIDRIDSAMHVGGRSPLNYADYGGVEYIALSAGTTAAEQPETFTHTLGEVITDGSVQWQAVQPEYTWIAVIDEVFSHTEFTVPDIDAPDDFFRWGVLTFIDGSNRARAVECLHWDNDTKRMTIMLPALTPIEPGTTIRVHAGCDKSRGEAGCKKFENILNFRGEPEVPGTDHYFKIGGNGQA